MNGVAIFFAPGSVTNFATIESIGSAGYGVVLSNGGTVANFGTILEIGTSGAGVLLGAGGSLTNGYSGSSAGVILAGGNAVDVAGSAGTVTNFGTIDGTGSSVGAIYLGHGGTVTNSGTLAGEAFGVNISNTSGAVINLGTITATSLSAFQVTGVALFGGSITNGGAVATSAVIYGVQYGAEIGNAAGTVVNFGEILAGATGGDGLRLVHGGTIDNRGTIEGPGAGIFLDRVTRVTNGESGTAEGYISGQTGVNMQKAGTVTNYGRIVASAAGYASGLYLPRGGTVHNIGTITASGTVAVGVAFGFLNAGGIVINGKSGSSAGLIHGGGTGVSIEASGGTVTNFAKITGGTDGVDMTGTVAVALNNFGRITGGIRGADLGGTAGTVTNLGTIAGTGTSSDGVELRAGGLVANNASGAARGLIKGATQGVAIIGTTGTVVNFGSIAATGTYYATAVYLGAGGSVTNSGAISAIAGSGTGIDFSLGGTVTNNAGGLIQSSADAVVIGGSAGGVTNHGTIGGGIDGIVLKSPGDTVVNDGTITGTASYGVYLVGGLSHYAGGRATNAVGGLIEGRYKGVLVTQAAATVTNLGTIVGTDGGNGIGVEFGSVPGTLTNAGTITGSGGIAVLLSGGGNRLIVDPGAVFHGVVNGGTGATDVLELGSTASAGTLAGLGTSFVNFGTVTVDSGAKWKLAGSNTLGAGVTLTDLGTLTITGSLGGAGTFVVDPASVINSGSIGVTVTLAGGSYLDNKAGGKISRAGTAVRGIGGAATVVNAGRIIGNGTTSEGIYLAAGGRVSNTTTTARIAGGGTGILVSGSAGTVSNRGTITSTGTGTSGIGVSLFAGRVTNGATNATGAVISGSHFGVEIQNSAGTVVNFGSITSSADTGIWLHAGTITNGPSGATHALISGPFDGVFVAVGKGTVNNYGTVVGGNSNDGVCLYAGGFVANGRKGATTALISGYAWGVEVQNSAGTVLNFGTVESTGTSGFTSGVFLKAGGTVTDAGTIRGSSGTAISFGGTSSNRLILDPGYHLGGTVVGSSSAGATNTLELGPGAATGTVSSVIATEFVRFGAVKVDAGARWVLASNNTIAARHRLTVAGTLTDLGTLTNAGVIAGSGKLIVDPATLFNSGSIGMTVTLAGGGVLTNKTTGQITAAGNAVHGIGGAATVVNAGTVIGTGGIGIELLAGGTIVDSGAISGGSGTAVSFGGAGANRLVLDPGYHLGGKVVGGTSAGATNTLELGSTASVGTVSGIASSFVHFGTVTVDAGAQWVLGGNNTIGSAGTLKNSGTLTLAGTLVDLGTLTNARVITGTGALIVDPATLFNSGSIGMTVTLAGGGYLGNKTAGRITAAGNGVIGISGAATVVNQGQITGTSGTGVRLTAGGRVTNQNSGSITGGEGGVYILGGAGTLSNSGTIASSSPSWDGVYLNAGGRVSNSGIVSGMDGVDLRGTGTVTNSGTITGGGSGDFGGVFLGFNYSAGAFRVNNTGSIISTAAGVLMHGAGTITNGSIVATGATISGSIGAQITGNGVATIVNFGTITGTGGIAVSLGTGNDRVVIEKGSVLNGAVSGFHIGDTFDLPFMSFSNTGTATLGVNNVLRVVENSGTFNIKLDPSQNFAGDFFHLTGDGNGGTLITENLTPPAPYTISPNPASVLDNAGHLTFTIKRTDASGPAVVYASVVQDQGFTNNGDYTFVNDMEVNFAAGVASVQVSVGIIDTGAASGSEVFRFIIQQHRTDPVSTFLASDKFTITNTTAAAAAALPRLMFADIAPAGPISSAANSGGPSNYLPGAIAANEQLHAGGPLLFATGHSGGSLFSLAGDANHGSLLPTLR